MKKILLVGVFAVLCLCTALFLIGKNEKANTQSWQEQYDLGVKLLGEGNYEEAILAFSAVIQIDPKQSDAYQKLADIYLEMGDLENAAAILEAGYTATGVASLADKLEEVRAQIEALLAETEVPTEPPTEPETELPSPADPPELPELLRPDCEYQVTSAVHEEERYAVFTEAAAAALEPVIAAGLSGDRETILEALETLDKTSLEEISYSWQGEHEYEFTLIGWTVWKGALIYYRNDGGLEYGGWLIEYRPEEGVGFQIQTDTRDEYGTFTVLVGQVSGWLFNGEFSYQEIHTEGEEITRTVRNSGAAKDELLHGEYRRWVQDAGQIATENYYMYEDGLPKPEYIDPESGAVCAWKEIFYLEDGTEKVSYKEYDEGEERYGWLAFALMGPQFG